MFVLCFYTVVFDVHFNHFYLQYLYLLDVLLSCVGHSSCPLVIVMTTQLMVTESALDESKHCKILYSYLDSIVAVTHIYRNLNGRLSNKCQKPPHKLVLNQRLLVNKSKVPKHTYLDIISFYLTGFRFLSVCLQPKVTGPCEALFRRYYYNSAAGLCEEFIYGGCQGNDNNFQTLAECEHRCTLK